MSTRLPAALEACLSARRAGASLDAVLAMYPDLATELLPLLEAADAAALPPHAAATTAVGRSRQRLLAHADRLRARPSRRHVIAMPRLGVGLAAAALVLFSGAGTFVAAARALPGDWLYPVKRTTEVLRLDLMLRRQARQDLSMRFEQQRQQEVAALLSLGREEHVSFEGQVIRQEGDLWLVAEVPVRISGETRGPGGIRPGMTVDASGSTGPDGQMWAERISLREYDLTGIAAWISEAAWQIGGRQMMIDASTQIDGAIQVGDTVLVRVRLSDAGTARAMRIRLLARAEPTPLEPVGASRPPSEGSRAEVDLRGEIEILADGVWIVDGLRIHLDGSTEVEVGLAVGDRVHVRALRRADGELWAARVERSDEDRPPEVDGTAAAQVTVFPTPESDDEVEWEGTVDSISGSTWVISGRAVVVDGQTEIEGDPTTGDTVRVRAVPSGTGLLAERIELRD